MYTCAEATTPSRARSVEATSHKSYDCRSDLAQELRCIRVPKRPRLHLSDVGFSVPKQPRGSRPEPASPIVAINWNRGKFKMIKLITSVTDIERVIAACCSEGSGFPSRK
ncbi:hypothetical protein Taro_026135 [Colocasia esculenta]|uniref:Uncharacterized protein n=1 Tax=Colocasia esculenta TaxID=4460 RepID=A0A843VG97_COLES|nr:hypothetical protein [Colocasia esculenta]